MNKKIVKSLIVFSFLCCAVACRILSPDASSRNIAKIFDPANKLFRFQHKSYMLNDSTLRLFFKINTTQLLFVKESIDDEYQAMVKLDFRVSSSYHSREEPDTSSLKLKFVKGQTPDVFSFHHDFAACAGCKYVIFVNLTDFYRKTKELTIIETDNQKYSQSDFYVSDLYDNIVYTDIIESGYGFFLSTRNKLNSNLYVRFYHNTFGAAPPPFTSAKERKLKPEPDSTFTITVFQGRSPEIFFNEPGIYMISANKEKNERPFLLLVSETGFPDIVLVRHMLGPMRYLTTRQEYQKMISQTNVKKSIDDFWIMNSGSPERAREMIRRYYTRVLEANQMFTSHYEGWKTDRGMIYIVYGPPNIIYRNDRGETWIYGEHGNIFSVTLNFNRVETNITNNEYVLNRSGAYKESWYNAVDLWRR